MEGNNEVKPEPTEYAIHAVDPTPITAGMQLVFFNRKSTVKNPVPDDEKHRSVMVPKFRSHQYEVSAEPKEASEVFAAAVEEAVNDAAGSILQAYVMEHGKDVKTIPASLLTFAAVLEEMQKKQTSQRLNGETIEKWYDASKTGEVNATRYGTDDAGKAKAAKLREKFLSLASNNAGITPDLATKMLTYISTDDAEHTTCKAVVKRLEKLSKTDTADDL